MNTLLNLNPMDTIYNRQLQDVKEIFNKALQAVHPSSLIRENVQLKENILTVGGKIWSLKSGQNIHVIATGKAAGTMSRAMEEVLGNRLKSGVAIAPAGSKTKTSIVHQLEGSHPVPDNKSVEATKKLLDLVRNIPSHDILFYLLSGGTSSLLCLPRKEISLWELQETGRALLESGATIHEINQIRKKLSGIKGGKLLTYLKDIALITLVISDVPGNVLEDIGSGPSIADQPEPGVISQILRKYGLRNKLPNHVLDLLDTTTSGAVIPEYEHQSVQLIGSAEILARKAGEIAQNMGYKTVVHEKPYQGEAREVARYIINEAERSKLKNKTAYIFVGESTVTINGPGKGGRNQELALAAAIEMDGKHHLTLLSAGTDGRDGPTDAAGAICSGNTLSLAREKGLDPNAYLNTNDSYHFFEALNDLFITGPTGNNLMDMQILLKE